MKRSLLLAFLSLLLPLTASAAPFAPGVGGTGTSTAPNYGKLLVGNAGGTYTLTATSSLGLPAFSDLAGYLLASQFGAQFYSYFHGTTTDYLTEGTTNKYYTDARVQTYLATVDKSFYFSTTSANAWKSLNNFFSTTSADHWKSARDFFSTTSASYFLSQNQGAAFSTTSADAWKTNRDFFSTTSAEYFLSQNQGPAFSTSSFNYALSIVDKGYFFSTTSADYWKSQRTFAGASTTLLSDRNAWSALQTFNYASSTALSGTWLCIGSDCRSSWPSAGTNASSTLLGDTNTFSTAATTTFSNGVAVGNLSQTGSATTTFARGITLAAGCFAIANNCISLANLPGQVTLTSQVTGALPLANGGLGSDVSGFGTGIFGLISGTLTDIDTLGEIETVVGSQNILLETEIDGCSELAALFDAETGGCNGTSGPVFPDSPVFSGNVGFSSSTPGATLAVNGPAIVAGTTTATVFLTSSSTATSTFAGSHSVLNFAQTGTATSTFNRGLTIAAGCFALNNACLLSILSASSPLTFSAGALGIQNAAADGSTKGAASFSANDFDASSGNISLDYTNGQKASGSQPGFLSSADYSTFNAKASFSYLFPNNATGTILSLTGALVGSSTVGSLNATNTIAVPISGILKGNGTGNAVGAAANGADYTLVSAQTCSAGQHISALTASGGSTCSSDSASLGYTAWGGSIGTTYGTSTVSSTTPIWLKGPIYASSTPENPSVVDNFTATRSTTTAATTSAFAISSVTSALHLANSTGGVTAYSGTSCTNQFVRSVNGAGVATCNTVSLTADVTGTLGVSNGGTGSTTLSGILKGNGTSQVATAVAGTDYVTPSQLFAYLFPSNATSTVIAFSAGTLQGTSTIGDLTATSSFKLPVSGILKGNGASTAVTAAVDGTDFSLITALTCSAGSHLSQVAANGDFTCSADTAPFSYPFPSNATTTGLGIYASSTIGAGGQATGLTVSGGATTTGTLNVVSTGTSTIAGGLNVAAINETGSATSTFVNGLTVSSGCFAIANNCLGLNNLPGTVSNSQLANSSLTITANTPLTGGGSVSLGGSVGISIQQASGSQNGYLSSTDWTTFNNKVSFGWPFTSTTWGGSVANATTTNMQFTGTIAATSTAGNLTAGTFTATTSITNKSVTSALVLNSSTGLEGAYAGSAPCSGTQAAFSISATGVITCTTVSTFAWPFTSTTWGGSIANSTTTLVRFDAGLTSATSSLGRATVGTLIATSSFTAPYTGLLQGNGSSAVTAITDSSTVGQVLRVTGSSAYAWGALNLASSNAVTGNLPIGNGGTNSNATPSTNALMYYNGTGIVGTTSNPLYVTALNSASQSTASGFGTSTPWALLSINPNGITGPAFAVGSTSATYFLINNGGNVGISTTSPKALVSINAPAGTPSFMVGSSTQTTFSIDDGVAIFWGNISFPIASSSAAAATYTVNWSQGSTQRFILNQNSQIVLNSTSSNPADGASYKLKICQDPTGGRTLTFITPGQLRWWNGTTSISTAANTCTWIGMIYDAFAGHYDVVASSTGVLLR